MADKIALEDEKYAELESDLKKKHEEHIRTSRKGYKRFARVDRKRRGIAIRMQFLQK